MDGSKSSAMLEMMIIVSVVVVFGDFVSDLAIEYTLRNSYFPYINTYTFNTALESLVF